MSGGALEGKGKGDQDAPPTPVSAAGLSESLKATSAYEAQGTNRKVQHSFMLRSGIQSSDVF